MKMRNAAAITLSLLLALSCAARDTPIYNGKLTSDLDASGFYIRNLPPDFFPTGPGGGGSVVSVNGKTGTVVLAASDVGALPVNGTAVSAELATLAENANNARNAEWAAFARDAGNAEYAASAGGVFWFDVYGKPDWLGDEKPTYTAEEVGALPADGIAIGAQYADTAPWIGVEGRPSWIGDEKPIYTATEVGAAPAKITLVLGGPSSNYELRLNGVAQTFDQVSNYVAHGEVIARHLDGFYKPTFLSGAEMMFDCTGLMAGDVRTRRIHMLKTNNKVVLDDTKILAEENWVLGLSTTYTNLAGSAFVSLNQSVQTVTVDGAPVTISMPTAVQGGTRDFVVYVNNTSAATDAPLVLPAGTYYADDDAATNAFTKGTVSALYITEMDGAFMIGRKELKQIVVH